MKNNKEKKISEYSLHVCADGEEVLFSELPRPHPYHHWMLLIQHYNNPVQVHHVIEYELPDGSRIEQTSLPTIECYMRIICPKPRGDDWKVHDNNSDKITVYRRPKPQRGGLKDSQ